MYEWDWPTDARSRCYVRNGEIEEKCLCSVCCDRIDLRAPNSLILCDKHYIFIPLIIAIVYPWLARCACSASIYWSTAHSSRCAHDRLNIYIFQLATWLQQDLFDFVPRTLTRSPRVILHHENRRQFQPHSMQRARMRQSICCAPVSFYNCPQCYHIIVMMQRIAVGIVEGPGHIEISEIFSFSPHAECSA